MNSSMTFFWVLLGAQCGANIMAALAPCFGEEADGTRLGIANVVAGVAAVILYAIGSAA